MKQNKPEYDTKSLKELTKEFRKVIKRNSEKDGGKTAPLTSVSTEGRVLKSNRQLETAVSPAPLGHPHKLLITAREIEEYTRDAESLNDYKIRRSRQFLDAEEVKKIIDKYTLMDSRIHITSKELKKELGLK